MPLALLSNRVSTKRSGAAARPFSTGPFNKITVRSESRMGKLAQQIREISGKNPAHLNACGGRGELWQRVQRSSAPSGVQTKNRAKKLILVMIRVYYYKIIDRRRN